jgi:tRNA threonylcarbamoyladenosine biosynthesis protein TsaB
MKILAIETSHRGGSVALLLGSELVVQSQLPFELPTTRTLHPTIKGVFQAAGWKPTDIQLVATTIGPGSFTGLRIGVTTAKTFAYAVGAELLGLDTLEVIAQRIPLDIAQVYVAVDAQRGDVVAAGFQRQADGSWLTIRPPSLVPFDQWLSSLPEEAFVTGPALGRYPIPEGVNVQVAPPEFWYPTAEVTGVLAWKYYQAGRRDDLWALVPKYARVSYAEEKIR